jgi:hypothetical protein
MEYSQEGKSGKFLFRKYIPDIIGDHSPTANGASEAIE